MNALLETSSPLSFSEMENNQIISRNKLVTTVLNSQYRLQEIFNLRLDVWEKSGKIEFINRKFLPTGWYDELDETAIHWAILNHQNQIVASARLNIFYSLHESPYFASINHLPLPTEAPFAFFSRLVVHPQYRQRGLSRQLYEARARFCKERKIAWSHVFINNPYIVSMFEAKGFKNIGEAEVSYHVSSPSHAVNVFVKENRYE
jgi:predicted GNAT family N-acyltransferase